VVAVSRDGQLLAVPEPRGRLRAMVIRETRTNKIVREFKSSGPSDSQTYYSTAAFSPDGRSLAISSHGSVHVFEIAGGHRVGVLPASGQGITQIQFSPDGQTASGLSNTIPKALGDSVEVHLNVWDVKSQRVRTTKANISYGRVNAPVAFSPNSQFLAHAFDED